MRSVLGQLDGGWRAALGVAVLVSPVPVAAQAPGGGTQAAQDGRVVSYAPDFFDEFRPTSAIDMVKRIPGFTYKAGNGGVRGLAGASGNVLIDGQRPASKSLSLDDVIRRIPVEAVARIDVVSGGLPGLDMQGNTVVANIIRVSGTRRAAAAEFMTKLYTDRSPAKGARLEGSLSKGALAVEGFVNAREEKEQGNSGVGRLIRRDGGGGVLQAGRFEAAWDRLFLQGSAAAEYRAGANLFRLSVSGQEERQDRLDVAELRDPAGTAGPERVSTDDLGREGEISLAFERSFGGGLDARLLVLEARELDRTISSSDRPSGAQVASEDAFAGESIVRAAATYVPVPEITLDARIERAFNFLDSESSLARNGIPVPIPSANIRVEERRVDVGVSARLSAWKGGTLEAGLAHESSTISQSGDVSRGESFRFWKPQISASIDPAPSWQLRLRAERLVGQLNFEDFASRASLDTGTVNAGNPELVPQKAWEIEAVLERRFWDRGAVTLTFIRAWLQDVIDLVPIEGRFDAPGNIGDGTRDEATVALNLPLDRLAVAGGLVRLKGTWRRSSVVDPVTLEERRISNQRPFQGELTVTKDLPALSSIVGVDLFAGFEERSYRISEVRTERSSTDPLVRLFWDWTPTPKTSLRVQVENFAFRERSRRRIFFSGSRRFGIISGQEERFAVLDPFLMVRFRRSF